MNATEIASILGVNEKRIMRILRSGAIPGAYKRTDAAPRQWVVPEESIPDIKAMINPKNFNYRADYDVIVSGICDTCKARDTPWTRGWHQILRRIPGASDISSYRFEAGVRTRAVAIPETLVFEGDYPP